MDCKVFGNISQTQEVWFFFRVFCFELADFYTTSIQKVVDCIVVYTQPSFFLDSLILTEYLACTVILLEFLVNFMTQKQSRSEKFVLKSLNYEPNS